MNPRLKAALKRWRDVSPAARSVTFNILREQIEQQDSWAKTGDAHYDYADALRAVIVLLNAAKAATGAAE